MRQDEIGLQLTILFDDRLHGFLRSDDGIIAGVKEADLGAQNSSGASGFGAADFLDFRNRHAGLFPGSLTLTAFAKGEAKNPHTIAAGGVKGDGAAGAPNEIGRVRAENEDIFLFRHVFNSNRKYIS